MKSNRNELTLVVQADHESPWQRTREIEENICTTVVWDIALLDHTLLLQLLMRELERTEHLCLLLFALITLGLSSDVVKVALIGLKLVEEICVMVTNSLEDLLELLSLFDNGLLQGAEVMELLLDLVSEGGEAVGLVNNIQIIEL